jgi:hypothetical protein
MILFKDVVEILDLADLNVGVMVGVVVDDCCCVGAALVDRDLLRNTMTTDGFAQEAQRGFTIPSGCQQEVHRGAGLVDRATQVFPCAFDPHIGLIPSPAAAHWTLACQERLLQSRNIFEDPTVKRGMINLDTTLSRHFLDLAVADRIATYQRTPHRMTSRSKWLPLNSTVIIYPREPALGSYTRPQLSENFRQNRKPSCRADVRSSRQPPPSSGMPRDRPPGLRRRGAGQCQDRHYENEADLSRHRKADRCASAPRSPRHRPADGLLPHPMPLPRRRPASAT